MKDSDITQNVTYVFSHTTLMGALKDWEQEQIENFPNQKERIQISVVAMQHFFRSQQVLDHKMVISGDPENFVIEMPESLEIEETEPKQS